jgi:murein L,D-transpeptidase YcbB/YkuD
MANDFAIRLHDTPGRNLFARDRRALSHGCIRVEAPDALAVGVLGRDDWTIDSVNAAIETGALQTVTLGEAMPVYLLYITATVNADGEIAYAEDIYRRDRAVVAALDGPDVALARRAAAAPARCLAEPSMP